MPILNRTLLRIKVIPIAFILILLFAGLSVCSTSHSQRELASLIKHFFDALESGKPEQLKGLFHNMSEEESLSLTEGQAQEKIDYQIKNISPRDGEATIVVIVSGEPATSTLTFRALRKGDSWKLDKEIEVQTALKEIIRVE